MLQDLADSEMDFLIFTVSMKRLAGNLPLGQTRKSFGGENFGGENFGGENFGGGKLWWGKTLVGGNLGGCSGFGG